MAIQNSINRKTQDLTIDPGASGDSYIQFNALGVNQFRIGNDDTDSSFRLSIGSALGTADSFKVTSSGERTLPLQPAFLAIFSTTQSNVTGDGTAVSPAIFNSTIFNQNIDYSTGTGIYTSSITARHLFTITMAYSDLAAGHTDGALQIVTSNRTYTIFDANPGVMRSSANDYAETGSVLADMDAADTAYISTSVSGSTKVVDLVGGDYSLFSGAIIV